jgi:hypothetical protein
MPTPMKNLHVPLPEPLYSELRAAAKVAGRPATELARDAIDRWLVEQRRTARRAAIAEYAASRAGTADDLDETLERGAVEALRGRPARRRRKA